MVDDLIENKTLIGKDTINLRKLLGQPTSQDSLNKVWTYDLGMGGGGLGFRFHTMYVNLENGKVTKVEHIRVDD